MALQTQSEPKKTVTKSSKEINRDLAKNVWAWYHEGVDSSSNFRKEGATDAAYDDGDQWTPEDRAEVEGRGQPALVINRVKPTVSLITGTESRARVEFHAAPRSDSSVADAEIATECVKYVMDQSGAEFLCADAFKHQIRSGWKFLEVCENDDPFGEIIKIGQMERDELIWDKYAKEFDLSDAKFMIRPKWLELEDAVALLPKHKDELEAAVSDEEQDDLKQSPYQGTEDQPDRPGVAKWDNPPVSTVEWVDKGRKRVKLIECWYKVNTETWFVQNELTGDFDEFDPDQAMDILFSPGVTITKKNIKKVRMCIVAGKDVLEDNPTPYRHNRYPFVPFWCYRKDKNGDPYGVVRQIRDPQDEINKRRSKALHLLNSRQIVASSDSIDLKQNSWKEVKEEAAAPDGTILLNPNSKGNFQFIEQTRAIEEQLKFETEAKMEIEEITGVGAELKGFQSNASSGRAIIARQVQGNTMLGEPFDNYRRSRQILYELVWAMIQQYWTKPKTVRITNKMGGYDFLELNKYIMDGSEILIQNDITKAKIDIVIDEEAYHATIRQALMEQMMTMVSSLPPEVSLMLLDLVIEYSDLPKKDEMSSRIKQIQQMLMAKQAVPPPPPTNGKGSPSPKSPGVGGIMENEQAGASLPALTQQIAAQMMGGTSG